jgi:ParB-like chromosome segregation protein Spo0J
MQFNPDISERQLRPTSADDGKSENECPAANPDPSAPTQVSEQHSQPAGPRSAPDCGDNDGVVEAKLRETLRQESGAPAGGLDRVDADSHKNYPDWHRDSCQLLAEPDIWNVVNVPVNQIHTDNRLRNLNNDFIWLLAHSMRTGGLIEPIVVRQDTDQDFSLVSGLHRLEAARSLKWTEVPCRIIGSDHAAARLIEIDANLVRLELSPAERAYHLLERKEGHDFISVDPRVKAANCANRALGRRFDAEALASPSFTEETALLAGISQRSVQRQLAVAVELGQGDLRLIAGSSLDIWKELYALVRLPAEDRDILIKRAAGGEQVTATHYTKDKWRKQRSASRTQDAGLTEELSAAESTTLHKLQRLWQRASLEEREAFLSWVTDPATA